MLPKSALKSSGVLLRGHWGRGRRTVQFQGSAQKALVHFVAHLSRICRTGCAVAGYWESFIAAIIIVDFLLVPLFFVVEAVMLAKQHQKGEREHEDKSQLDAGMILFYISIGLDLVFILNTVFRVAQVVCHWHTHASLPIVHA